MHISAISAIAANPTDTGTLTVAEQVAAALLALQKGLVAGDLTAAQTALKSFQALEQTSAAQTGGTSQNLQLTGDLQTIGSALDLGNLGAANAAFSALQTALKNPLQASPPTASGLTVEDVVTLLSALPGYANSATGSSSSTAADIGSNLLSTLSASSSAAVVAAATQAAGTSQSGIAPNSSAAALAAASTSQLNIYA